MDFVELVEKLKTLDEVTLLEILEISAEDLVDRFVDKIEIKETDLYEAFEEEEDQHTPIEGELEWWEDETNE